MPPACLKMLDLEVNPFHPHTVRATLPSCLSLVSMSYANTLSISIPPRPSWPDARQFWHHRDGGILRDDGSLPKHQHQPTRR